MFLLPIYSETSLEFENWLRERVKIELLEIEERTGIPASISMEERLLEQKKDEYGSRWKFNRAVGWIFIDRAVGGFTFHVAVASNKKRREPKRFFIPLDLLDQPNEGKHIKFPQNASESKIIERFEIIFHEIITREHAFKGCYVDYSTIKDNAPFIKWNEIHQMVVPHRAKSTQA